MKRTRREYLYAKRQRYLYKVWDVKRFVKPPRLKDNYLIPRLLRNYYLIMNRSFIINRAQQASRGMGKFVSKLIIEFEGRLYNLVYRVNWISNIFMVKSIIDLGCFVVNNKFTTYPLYQVKLGDIVWIRKPWDRLIRLDMRLRLRGRKKGEKRRRFAYKFAILKVLRDRDLSQKDIGRKLKNRHMKRVMQYVKKDEIHHRKNLFRDKRDVHTRSLVGPGLKGVFVSYIFMLCFIFKDIKKKDLFYPVNVDLYRALDFMGPLR